MYNWDTVHHGTNYCKVGDRYVGSFMIGQSNGVVWRSMLPVHPESAWIGWTAGWRQARVEVEDAAELWLKKARRMKWVEITDGKFLTTHELYKGPYRVGLIYQHIEQPSSLSFQLHLPTFPRIEHGSLRGLRTTKVHLEELVDEWFSDIKSVSSANLSLVKSISSRVSSKTRRATTTS